jgi:hypothetical protein
MLIENRVSNKVELGGRIIPSAPERILDAP